MQKVKIQYNPHTVWTLRPVIAHMGLIYSYQSYYIKSHVHWVPRFRSVADSFSLEQSLHMFHKCSLLPHLKFRPTAHYHIQFTSLVSVSSSHHYHHHHHVKQQTSTTYKNRYKSWYLLCAHCYMILTHMLLIHTLIEWICPHVKWDFLCSMAAIQMLFLAPPYAAVLKMWGLPAERLLVMSKF